MFLFSLKFRWLQRLLLNETLDVSSWNVGHVLKTAQKWSNWSLIWEQEGTNVSLISHIHVRFLSCVISFIVLPTLPSPFPNGGGAAYVEMTRKTQSFFGILQSRSIPCDSSFKGGLNRRNSSPTPKKTQYTSVTPFSALTAKKKKTPSRQDKVDLSHLLLALVLVLVLVQWQTQRYGDLVGWEFASFPGKLWGSHKQLSPFRGDRSVLCAYCCWKCSRW